MERVQAYLAKLLQSHRFGGKIVARDEKTLIVYDTPAWGEKEARALRARFPECDVAVQASDMSMSGFIVLVTRISEPWAAASEFAFFAALAGLGWTAWWLSSYLPASNI